MTREPVGTWFHSMPAYYVAYPYGGHSYTAMTPSSLILVFIVLVIGALVFKDALRLFRNLRAASR